MSISLLEDSITCPYCWEIVEILVDPSASQTYTEDCYVCCRPILIDATISEGKAVIQVTQEDLGF